MEQDAAYFYQQAAARTHAHPQEVIGDRGVAGARRERAEGGGRSGRTRAGSHRCDTSPMYL